MFFSMMIMLMFWRIIPFYCAHKASLIDVVTFTSDVMVRKYGFVKNVDYLLCIVDQLGHDRYKDKAERVIQAANLWANGKLDIVNGMLVHVYKLLAWKQCVAPLYATVHLLTKEFLLFFQPMKLVFVLYRKMINRGTHSCCYSNYAQMEDSAS